MADITIEMGKDTDTHDLVSQVIANANERSAVALGQELAHLGGRWPELAWVLQSPFAIAAGLLLIAGPGLLQWLEE